MLDHLHPTTADHSCIFLPLFCFHPVKRNSTLSVFMFRLESCTGFLPLSPSDPRVISFRSNFLRVRAAFSYSLVRSTLVLEFVFRHFIFIPQKYQNVYLFRATMRMRFPNKLPAYVLAIQLVQNRGFRRVVHCARRCTYAKIVDDI